VHGNGLLVCDNCSYFCNVCNKKIEDLAILTGDKAFCSSCFCCRNCKKKIEDLQYAQAPQGIFCMKCNEAILAQKKRYNHTMKKLHSKSQSLPDGKSDFSNGNKMKTLAESLEEKLLPSLPSMETPLQAANANSPPTLPISTNPSLYPPSRHSRLHFDFPQPQNPNLNLHYQQLQQQNILGLSSVPNSSVIQEDDAEKNSFKPATSILQSTLGSSLNNKNNKNECDSQKSIMTALNEMPSSTLVPGFSPPSEYQLKNFLDFNISSEVGNLQKTLDKLAPLNTSACLYSTSSRAGVYLEASLQSTELSEKGQEIFEQDPVIDSNKLIPEHSRMQSYSPHKTPLDTGSAVLKMQSPIIEKYNRPRKNSEPILVNFAQGPYSPLGDYKTRQKLTSQHQRSASDSNRVSQTSNHSNRHILTDKPISTIAHELAKAKKKIAELETKLSAPSRNNEKLVSNILEKRKTIAGLEAQNEIATKELQFLEQACRKNTNTPMNLVSEFTKEVAQIKSALQAEIETLMIQREELREQNNQLCKQHEESLEAIALMNLKNNQLIELHNELTRQIMKKYKNFTKLPHGVPVAKDFPEPPTSIMSDGDASTVAPSISDEPLVTILEGSDEKKEKQQVARRFWKRPTAAVAKGVKGFNKVFLPENTLISAGPYSDVEPAIPDAQSSNVNAANGVGLNIVMLGQSINQKELSTRSSSKRSGNGWFKGGSDNNNKESLLKCPIEKRIQIENTKIPLIVTRCIQEVEQRGMLFEGIYRKSGARSQIAAIEEAFEKTFDLNELDQKVLTGDIAGVTSAVKQYLRYLPVPLIHFNLYDRFVAAAAAANISESTQAAVEELRIVINTLPPTYRDTLQFVMAHLVKITQFSDKNLMTSRNLAVCFAPTIVRHHDGNRELRDMQARNDGTQLLMDYYSTIFVDHL
jgi:hypothetical protein